MAQVPDLYSCYLVIYLPCALKNVIHLNVCVCWSRKLADGLFLECCKEVASGYPEISFDSMIVDNTTMQVITACNYF